MYLHSAACQSTSRCDHLSIYLTCIVLSLMLSCTCGHAGCAKRCQSATSSWQPYVLQHRACQEQGMPGQRTNLRMQRWMYRQQVATRRDHCSSRTQMLLLTPSRSEGRSTRMAGEQHRHGTLHLLCNLQRRHSPHHPQQKITARLCVAGRAVVRRKLKGHRATTSQLPSKTQPAVLQSSHAARKKGHELRHFPARMAHTHACSLRPPHLPPHTPPPPVLPVRPVLHPLPLQHQHHCLPPVEQPRAPSCSPGPRPR
jgi:hypothetical protein